MMSRFARPLVSASHHQMRQMIEGQTRLAARLEQVAAQVSSVEAIANGILMRLAQVELARTPSVKADGEGEGEGTAG